jgi:Protein of unknown function (DUF4238)
MGQQTRLPRELRAVFEQATRNAEGTPPRKHHLVPASYLRRWAEDGKIRVTVVDQGQSHLSGPTSAARETDYYRIDHPEVNADDIPPLLIETVLGKLEDNAKIVIDDLLAHRDAGMLDPSRLLEFSQHLAFSITRGKAFRDENLEMFTDLYRMQYERFTDGDIRARLRKFGTDPTAEEVAKHRQFLKGIIAGDIVPVPPAAQIIALSAMVAAPLCEHLLQRTWVVYECPPILVTCDEPVGILGGPGSPRSERSGVEVAGVIIFPLCPSAVLAMFHPDITPSPPARLNHIETTELNKEIIAAAARWAFERPTRRVTECMRVPPAPPKASVREGPLPQVEGSDGELYRTCRPTRWVENEAPAWPVARWWSDGWTARQFPRLANLPPGAKVAVARDQGLGHKRKTKKR